MHVGLHTTSVEFLQTGIEENTVGHTITDILLRDTAPLRKAVESSHDITAIV
jgi:hypothetical protein